MEPTELLGVHRSLEPKGALPQPAWRVDNDMSKRFESEILLDVETLNIDAASFRQLEQSTRDVAQAVQDIVIERGKMHNPVTGSGGMLLGRVAWVGSYARARGFRVGERVATLASLSLTPLKLDAIRAVRHESAQLDVVGQAISFYSAPLVQMPSDFSDRVALALFDVAGAAPQVSRRAFRGARVLVLGAGGKSGLLCAAEARRCVGEHGQVIGIEAHGPSARDLERLDICDKVYELDATDALAVHKAVGKEVDVTFSCVNVEGVEMSAVLATKARGAVVFFAMTTSFTRATLGAEGVGKDIDLIMGNGFAEGHAAHTLDLVRNHRPLRELFERRYG